MEDCQDFATCCPMIAQLPAGREYDSVVMIRSAESN